MTAVVHIFESPLPKSAREARALVDGGAFDRGPGCARFPAFAQALRARYPDAHTLEASGNPGDDSVWADSPLQVDASSSLLTLGLLLSNADETFWPFLVHAAADHGLHVYDPQRGTLWRADRRVADLDGREQPFPPRPSAAPRRLPEGFPLEEEAVLDRMFTGLDQALAPRGWRFHREGPYGDWYARRERGSVAQVMDLHAGVRRNDPDCLIGVIFRFEEPAIAALLREVLPEDAPRREVVKRNLGGRYGDVSARVHEIFGPLAKPITPDVFARVQGLSGLDAWTGRFGDWLCGPAGTILDATGDARALARLVLGEQRRARIMQIGGHEIPGLLALAHLVHDPTIDFEAWVAVAVDQCDRNFGSALRNARELPHRAHEWKDSTDMARHIELLIGRLRARRPGLALSPLE